MAIILAAQTGIWTDPATWVGGIVPGPGDVAVSNTRTITFNANCTVLQLRRDATGGATAGGFFAFVAATANNLIITADVYAGNAGAAGPCVAVGSMTACVIVGTIYGSDYGPGSSGITSGIYGVSAASTSSLRVLRTVSGARGMPAINGPFQFIDSPNAQAIVRATGSLTEVTLRDVAGWEPDPSDVLIGTSYEGRTGIMVPVPQRQKMTAMAMSGGGLNLEMLTDELGATLTTDEGDDLLGI